MTTAAKAPKATKEQGRKPGFEHLLEHFPHARQLWSLTTPEKDGFVNAFSVTAYNVEGQPVLLQEFGEDLHHSWDVYVQASKSGEIAETINDLKNHLGLGKETNAAEEIASAIACLQRAGQKFEPREAATANLASVIVAALRGHIVWRAGEGWQVQH